MKKLLALAVAACAALASADHSAPQEVARFGAVKV